MKKNLYLILEHHNDLVHDKSFPTFSFIQLKMVPGIGTYFDGLTDNFGK